MRKLSLITVTTMAALGLAGAPNCSNNLTDLLQQYKNQNNSCIISEQCGTDSQKEVQEKLNTLLGNLNLCNLNLCDLNLNNTCKTPTVTPKPTKAPTVTKAPTATPTQAPTVTKTPKPTQVPTATPKPTQVPTATPKPTQVPKPTAVPTPTISQQEQTYASEVVKLVNEERAKAGLSALTINTTVEKAALIRAKEIVTSFSHTRPSGQSFSTALTEVGASFRGAGENIAWGQRSPEEVMNAWMNSSGHRANILNSKYTTIGIGVYQSGGRIYWSQLFTY